MADAVPDNERYSLFMPILSTHCGVWGLYTIEWHVCSYWPPPFDSQVTTFAARWWGRKRQAVGNLQSVITIVPYCKLPSVLRFRPDRLAAKVNQMAVFSKCKHVILSYADPQPRNVCLIFAWTANIFPYRDPRPPCWLLVIAVGNCGWW